MHLILYQTSGRELTQNPICQKLPMVQKSKQKLTVKRQDAVFGFSMLSHWWVAWMWSPKHPTNRSDPCLISWPHLVLSWAFVLPDIPTCPLSQTTAFLSSKFLCIPHPNLPALQLSAFCPPRFHLFTWPGPSLHCHHVLVTPVCTNDPYRLPHVQGCPDLNLNHLNLKPNHFPSRPPTFPLVSSNADF